MEVFAQQTMDFGDSDEDMEGEREKGDGEAMEEFAGQADSTKERVVGEVGGEDNKINIGDTVKKSIEVEVEVKVKVEVGAAADNKAVNGEEFKVITSEVMQTNIEETAIPKVGHAVAAVEHEMGDIGRSTVDADRLQAEVSTTLSSYPFMC